MGPDDREPLVGELESIEKNSGILAFDLKRKPFEIRLLVNALLREGPIVKLDTGCEGGPFFAPADYREPADRLDNSDLVGRDYSGQYEAPSPLDTLRRRLDGRGSKRSRHKSDAARAMGNYPESARRSPSFYTRPPACPALSANQSRGPRHLRPD
jgi:hypothetical protein